MTSGVLTFAQEQALAFHTARAERARAAARATVARILADCAIDDTDADAIAEGTLARARVTLSFHPDRLQKSGVSVVEGLLTSGRYLSQFETGVTSGSPTAYSGGERDHWEATLFGGAYQRPGTALGERPTYGAFDVIHHADGGSPRFGSCYVVLRREAWPRCTLTWGDSHEGPEHVGTTGVFEPILAPLLDSFHRTRAALGLADLDVVAALAHLRAPPPREPSIGRALDAYVETQVHGELLLARDVAALVIDPSFDGTAIGRGLETLAASCRVPLLRHAGFELAPDDVPPDFRGPRMIPLARRVMTFASRRERFDAATLGRAAASLHHEPERWADWGTPAETWQHLKQLWHVLVAHGRPFGTG